MEIVFEDGIHRGHEGLHHVIKQVAEADGGEDFVEGDFLRLRGEICGNGLRAHCGRAFYFTVDSAEVRMRLRGWAILEEFIEGCGTASVNSRKTAKLLRKGHRVHRVRGECGA